MPRSLARDGEGGSVGGSGFRVLSHRGSWGIFRVISGLLRHIGTILGLYSRNSGNKIKGPF